MEVYCDTCPIRYCCDTYTKESEDNANSYHPKDIVTAFKRDCPIIKALRK